jgi:hypothetical protein
MRGLGGRNRSEDNEGAALASWGSYFSKPEAQARDGKAMATALRAPLRMHEMKGISYSARPGPSDWVL